MRISKIISGGQTGADQARLVAAKELGLQTGGWMPKGWRTDEGPRPEFKDLYNMKQHVSWEYPPRTRCNVRDSNATLLVGDITSPGSRLTMRLCREIQKPYFIVPWHTYKAGILEPTGDEGVLRSEMIKEFLLFCETHPTGIRTLNVAGNRERTQRGIFLVTKNFLIRALREQK